MTAKTPIVTEMQVIPVAGYDSMEMTLSGARRSLFYQKSGDFKGQLWPYRNWGDPWRRVYM